MTQPVILSRDTACKLLEAHATLAAWYYRLSAAARAAGKAVEPPDVPLMRAVLEQLARDFPELAPVALGIESPQQYIPPPAPLVPQPPDAADSTAAGKAPPPSRPPGTPIDPPPLVDPKKVRYS